MVSYIINLTLEKEVVSSSKLPIQQTEEHVSILGINGKSPDYRQKQQHYRSEDRSWRGVDGTLVEEVQYI